MWTFLSSSLIPSLGHTSFLRSSLTSHIMCSFLFSSLIKVVIPQTLSLAYFLSVPQIFPVHFLIAASPPPGGDSNIWVSKPERLPGCHHFPLHVSLPLYLSILISLFFNRRTLVRLRGFCMLHLLHLYVLSEKYRALQEHIGRAPQCRFGEYSWKTSWRKRWLGRQLMYA